MGRAARRVAASLVGLSVLALALLAATVFGVTFFYRQLANDRSRGPGGAEVTALDHVKTVTSGYGHSLALLDDGTVRAWGNNDKGELGDGTTNYRTTPVTVLGLTHVVALAAGLWWG